MRFNYCEPAGDSKGDVFESFLFILLLETIVEYFLSFLFFGRVLQNWSRGIQASNFLVDGKAQLSLSYAHYGTKYLLL